MKNPLAAATAMPLFTCTKSNCWSENEDVSIGAGPDCSKAACGKVCNCIESKCVDPMNKCLSDPHCAEMQDCAMGCACGDHTCTLGCAMKNPLAAATAMPLFTCTKSNCWSENEDVSIGAGPDCSKAACGKVCNCIESKCVDPMNKCLSDPKCAAMQDCAMGCACGDHTCTLGCAMKN